MCYIFFKKNFDYCHRPYQFDTLVENSATCIDKLLCTIGQLVLVKVPESLNTGQYVYELVGYSKFLNHFFYKDTVVKNETQGSITIFSLITIHRAYKLLQTIHGQLSGPLKFLQ